MPRFELNTFWTPIPGLWGQWNSICEISQNCNRMSCATKTPPPISKDTVHENTKQCQRTAVISSHIQLRLKRVCKMFFSERQPIYKLQTDCRLYHPSPKLLKLIALTKSLNKAVYVLTVAPTTGSLRYRSKKPPANDSGFTSQTGLDPRVLSGQSRSVISNPRGPPDITKTWLSSLMWYL